MSEAQDKEDSGERLGERLKGTRDTGVYRFFKEKTPEQIVDTLVDAQKVGSQIKDRLYETAKVFSQIINKVTGLEAMIGEHNVHIPVDGLQASVGSALRQIVHLTEDYELRLVEMEKAHENLAKKVTVEAEQRLEAIKKKAEVVRENVALYKQIMTDQPTGLYSRRFFFTDLPEQIKLAEKRQEPLSVIVYDINNFKRANDTYGHDAGDFVIKEISKLAQMLMPKAYIVARLGGDEFGIILPRAVEQEAYEKAETLRKAVKEHLFVYTLVEGDFEYDYKIEGVTIALGVKQHEPAESSDDLYRGADAAFYVAHKQGKDKTVRYSEFEQYIKRMPTDEVPVQRPKPVAIRQRKNDK
jgi:diguanylate cyclase (GGDEF)-like protein